METVKSIVIAAAGLSGAIVLLITAVTTIRDYAIERGWYREGSWIHLSWKRAQHVRISTVLGEMGWQGGHARALRDADERIRIQTLPAPSTASELPQRLIKLLKPMTRELPPGRCYGDDNKYYVDTMGAVHDRRYRNEIVWLTTKWLKFLMENEKLKPFDCVLANKQGNPTLVSNVCGVWSSDLHVPPVVCKHELDGARVKGGGCVPHQTDFEGLQAFLEERSEAIKKGNKFRAIALDDQCAGGKAICSLMTRFNKLIATQQLPFEPVIDAVVLLVIGDDKTAANFGTKFRLHSLLYLDEERKKTIMDGKTRDATPFLVGFGCESINDLIAREVKWRGD